MPQFNIKLKGWKEFEKAIKRNPGVVRDELSSFFVDTMRSYNKTIIRNPWRVGGSGGGAPVDTGRLRDRAHMRDIQTWRARIYVNQRVAGYALDVHEGTSEIRKRPWLDYAFDKAIPEIKLREQELLKNIVDNLAK